MIVDASVVMKWLIPEHDSDAAIALLSRVDLAAPDAVDWEIGHALTKMRRTGQLPVAESWRAWRKLAESPMSRRASATCIPAAFDLSLKLAAPFYDCLYLALAIQLDDRLITADERFVRAVLVEPSLGGRILSLADF